MKAKKFDLIEITDPVQLTWEERHQIGLHSFLNLANILSAEVTLLRSDFGSAEFSLLTESVERFLQAVKDGTTDWEEFADTLVLGELFEKELQEGLARHPDLKPIPEIDQLAGNIRSILTVLAIRSDEILLRDPTDLSPPWESHSVSRLRGNFEAFFAAVGRNSKGRYRITQNVAHRRPEDYLITFGIDGSQPDEILMPAIVQDVFRDLIANARKYTPVGGHLAAGLYDNGKELKMVIEDDGRGIPEEDLLRVVEFGYRGTNVGEHTTKGSGFGLTKAYDFVRRAHGRFWIGSKLLEGTRIEIWIPRPVEHR